MVNLDAIGIKKLNNRLNILKIVDRVINNAQNIDYFNKALNLSGFYQCIDRFIPLILAVPE
jgi:hypothetical protein